MSTAQTMRHYRTPSNGSGRRFAGLSPLLRVERIQVQSANLCRMTLTAPAKRYAPLLSRHEVSGLLNNGGCIGRTKVLMLADPANALRYAEHLLTFARSLTGQRVRPLADVMLAEQRADGDEDYAQVDLLADESPASLQRYIDAGEEAIARLREAVDAARARKEELERGEP